eukprot:1156171-Rhodomonas_salina.1
MSALASFVIPLPPPFFPSCISQTSNISTAPPPHKTLPSCASPPGSGKGSQRIALSASSSALPPPSSPKDNRRPPRLQMPDETSSRLLKQAPLSPPTRLGQGGRGGKGKEER